MKHFFEPHPGQLLYHYANTEGAEAIIANETLRLSEFSMMNDSSEYTYAKKRFLETYHNREVWIEEVPRYLMSMRLASHEAATVMMIGCLTEERDDVGLWDRYGSNGAGCVVGIDASWLANRAGATLRRISYEPGDMRDFVNAGLLMLQGQYEEAPKDTGQLSELAAFFILDLYAFKDPRFRSEREVRISRLADADASTMHGLAPVVGHNDNGEELPPLPVQLFNSRFGPKRFIDLPLRYSEPRSAIRSVGLGPTATAETRKKIVAACGCSNIDIWQSDVPLR
ncbi:hypothetical protein [Rhizobium ruizarguesonis]|uniref:hypothetical protein n=1 Tax=Rhizobium ruizarguesonis TaxID=2081791 RepID=UPI0013E0B4B3|nr:hypothetical protein [Rhizobium ruizarguesonis]NEJ98816.1 hypothetical protein [Rhizobium ruizarguesonis]